MSGILVLQHVGCLEQATYTWPVVCARAKDGLMAAAGSCVETCIAVSSFRWLAPAPLWNVQCRVVFDKCDRPASLVVRQGCSMAYVIGKAAGIIC